VSADDAQLPKLSCYQVGPGRLRTLTKHRFTHFQLAGEINILRDASTVTYDKDKDQTHEPGTQVGTLCRSCLSLEHKVFPTWFTFLRSLHTGVHLRVRVQLLTFQLQVAMCVFLVLQYQSSPSMCTSSSSVKHSWAVGLRYSPTGLQEINRGVTGICLHVDRTDGASVSYDSVLSY
jgi:hypothetical protein